jgi:uncharacterized membrane protein YeaQ/YmgE (transglycosylase-associated protein family)
MIELLLVILIVLFAIWLMWKLSVGFVSLIVMILGGALAGWLAGQFIIGHGQGFWWNLVCGIAGALLGNVLFYLARIKLKLPFFLDDFIRALVGASILLAVKKYLL